MSLGPFPCDPGKARPLGRAEELLELQAATMGPPPPAPFTACRRSLLSPQHEPCCLMCWAGDCPLGDVSAPLLLHVQGRGCVLAAGCAQV